MKNSLNYKIPNRKKNLLTDAFLSSLKTEIDDVFGIKKTNENPTYYNFYGYIGGTTGFLESLKRASQKHNILTAIYEYEQTLPWYESDSFDEEVIQLMVSKNIIELGEMDDCLGQYPTPEELLKMEKDGEIKWVTRITKKKGYTVISRDWEFID